MCRGIKIDQKKKQTRTLTSAVKTPRRAKLQRRDEKKNWHLSGTDPPARSDLKQTPTLTESGEEH